jgi:hypothetical protein
VVGGVVALLLFAGMVGHHNDSTSSSSSSSSPAASTTVAPEATTTTSVAPPIDPNNPPVISGDRDNADLHAVWTKGADGTEHVTINEGSGEGDAKTDTVAVLKVAQQYFPGETISIVMLGSACDAYGNCHDKDVLDLLYDSATMAKFNFNGDYFSRWSSQGQENKNRIWALADSCLPHVNNWECERL